MSQPGFAMPIFRLFPVLLLASLVACGGGGGDTVGSGTPNPSSAAPVRIQIAPDTVLLTAAQQEKQLVATVFDAAGNPVAATVQWRSSRPGQVDVDANGKLRATGSGGSAQITASVGNVQSPPLLAVHTQVPAGAVLLTDANIAGQPEETTPGATASFSNTYRARLVGVAAPRIGDLVINTESKVVAGRVLAVATTNGEHLVTLGLVPAREMFPALNIDEAMDLSRADVSIPPEIAAAYTVQRTGDTFTFTPKPGQVNLNARPVAGTLSRVVKSAGASSAGPDPSLLTKEFSLGPFLCKAVFDGAAGTGSEIMALTLPPLFTVALSPRLDVVSSSANGLERLVVHSEPSVTLEIGVKALIAAELKATCEAEVLAIKIPVGGPLSLIVGGVLPVGIGAELGGKFTFVNLGISGKATAKTTGDVGVSCPASASCGIVADFGKLDVNFTPSIDLPSTSDLRFEPSLSAYAFAKASIGNPLLKSLRFDAFKVKAGGAFKGNFSTRGSQIADASYQSDYKLVSELKAGADTGFTGLAAFFGLNSFVETLLEVSSDIGGTPAGTLVADTPGVVFGENTSFTVTLDPRKADFIPLVGPYNVERVVLLRRNGDGIPLLVASLNAQPGQTAFRFESSLLTTGRIDDFYAFVVTKLLPNDNFSLELAQASGAVPVVVTASLPSALENTAYQASLESNLPSGAGVWRVSAGRLPAGMTLNGDSGVISGTPRGSGTSAFTVQLSAGAQSAQKALSIEVSPAALIGVQFASGRVRIQDFSQFDPVDVNCNVTLRMERTVTGLSVTQFGFVSGCTGRFSAFGGNLTAFSNIFSNMVVRSDGTFSQTEPNGPSSVNVFLRLNGRLSDGRLNLEQSRYRGDIDVVQSVDKLSTFEGTVSANAP